MMYAKLYQPATKMANQALAGLNLGNCTHQPGFIMLDPATKKTHVVIHVRCVENECPGLTMSKERWEQCVPSFADEYDADAERAPDAPILEDTRTVLEPAPEPLFVESESSPAAPAHAPAQAGAILKL